jgi:hypothetical protein
MGKESVLANEEIQALEVIAKHAHDSKFFNNLGGLPGIFSIMLYAKELGVMPMQAVMGGMHSIMGKVQIAPQLMNAMIRKAGHKMKIDSNDQRCIIEGTRKDTGETCTVSFSIEDAKKAGLYKDNGGWAKYPSDMCFARAISRLARRLFPDVIGMAYVEGEVEADDEKETKSTIEAPTIDTEPSEAELSAAFKEKFKAIENMDFDLNDFVEFTSKKSGKSTRETMKQAVKNHERFEKAYLKWVEEKKPLEEISIVEEAKVGEVNAKQMNLV